MWQDGPSHPNFLVKNQVRTKACGKIGFSLFSLPTECHWAGSNHSIPPWLRGSAALSCIQESVTHLRCAFFYLILEPGFHVSVVVNGLAWLVCPQSEWLFQTLCVSCCDFPSDCKQIWLVCWPEIWGWIVWHPRLCVMIRSQQTLLCWVIELYPAALKLTGKLRLD